MSRTLARWLATLFLTAGTIGIALLFSAITGAPWTPTLVVMMLFAGWVGLVWVADEGNDDDD
jgi:hypothetical protein